MKRIGLFLLSICFVLNASLCFGVAVPFKIWLNTNQSATPATNESAAIINSTSNTMKWQRYNGSDWVDLVYSGLASGLSGVSALPNGTTATTQTQADASTKVATTAYVDTGLGTKQATITWGTGLSASGSTVSFAPTELDNITWGTAANGSKTLIWDTGSGTDSSLIVSDSYFTFNKTIQCAGIETTRSATVGGSIIIGYEGSNNGDSYVSLKAPDSRSTTLTFLYPTADPNDQVLSWGAPSTGVSTGTWITPALSTHTHTYTESFVVKSPVDADDFLLMKAPASLTITAFNCVAQVTTSGSITAAVQECDGDGANCADGGISLTADGSNDADASFTDASIDSGDWLKVVLGAPTGTVNFLSCTLSYTR